MSLKSKVIPFVIFVNLLFIVGIVLFTQFLISNKINDIEKKQIVNLTNRTQSIIENKKSTLATTVRDYAVWDDTFNYINKQNDSYILSNYKSDTFSSYNIDFVFIANNRFDELYSQSSARLERKLLIELVNEIKGAYTGSPIDGLYLSGQDKLMFIAAQPVSDSKNEESSNGVLIMGTLIEEEQKQEINDLIGQELIWLAQNDNADGKLISEGEDNITISAVLRSINNKDIPTSINLYRDIKVSIFETRNYLVMGLLIIGIVVTVIAIIFINEYLLKPVNSLLDDVTKINSLGMDAPQIHIPSRDEFGKLAIGINRMLIKLKHSHDQIVDFESQLSEYKAIEEKKDEFFSIASHELRTPLTAIRGNIEYLMKTYSSYIQENNQVREVLDDVRTASQRLIQIVNDFLTTSKIDEEELKAKYEVFNLCEVVEEVIRELHLVALEKQITIEVNKISEAVPVNADINFVRQILQNIIGNAVKFSLVNGHVNCVINKENTIASIDISDNGKGIPESEQIQLFQRFKQGYTNPLARDMTKGSGLGLYIAKKLAMNIGGDVILLKSKEGEGSTFRVTLPLAL